MNDVQLSVWIGMGINVFGREGEGEDSNKGVVY